MDVGTLSLHTLDIFWGRHGLLEGFVQNVDDLLGRSLRGNDCARSTEDDINALLPPRGHIGQHRDALF